MKGRGPYRGPVCGCRCSYIIAESALLCYITVVMKNKSISGKDEAYERRQLSLRFCWHVDGMIAGSARPGRYGELDKDLEFLQDQGIDLIVNLTTSRLEIPDRSGLNMEEVHEPLYDGHPPEGEQLERILTLVQKATAEGKKVVVHCRGGIGRTATVLIPLIMTLEGLTLEDAIGRLRKSGRYTQSMDQWEFLKKWAENKA